MVEGGIDDAVNNVTKAIIHAANAAIPKTSPNNRKNCKPWWNTECTEAKKQQQRVWNNFRRYPTTENLIAFKAAKAHARKIRRRTQKESWVRYVSTINTSTPSKELWNKAKKAMGIYKDHPIPCITQNGLLISDVNDIVNVIGHAFASVSKADTYSREFSNVKQQSEKKKLNFSSSSMLPYNRPFSDIELRFCLKKTRDTSPGHDLITYSMIKHLSHSSVSNLLHLYNRIWEEHTFPCSWQKAIVIPFPKPGKDTTNPNNYRPIALTSCLCKLFEKMVNNRLVYELETRNLLAPFQSGFRTGRSTIDNILYLETLIRDAFLKKNHLVSIFFDMEKAYDRTWRYGILRDLYDMDFRGNMPIFIKNFLSRRQFQVRLGNNLSNSFTQEEGVPQGSVLSVTLFSIKINNILNELPPSVKGCLYVDDLQISCQGKDMRFIERQLQTSVRKILNWTNNNGFTLSADKTFCIHFCRNRNVHPDPDIFLGSTKLNVVDFIKFLGIIFDKKLTFLPHILHIRTKCEKALNLLKVLSNTAWGADRTSMLRIYRAAIRSKLDYACSAYGSARTSVLHKLDTVHHLALRICNGAFRTSPIQSLYVDCCEPSLQTIRDQQSLILYHRILSHPSHPLQPLILDRECDLLYLHRSSCIPYFGLRMRNLMRVTNTENVTVLPNNPFIHPPWRDPKVSYLNPFKNFFKSNTDSLIYQQLFAVHRSRYAKYREIYTDGSSIQDHVGWAYVYDRSNVSCNKIHKYCSVFTSEFLAVKEALNHISRQTYRHFIVYSDSQSVLEALNSENQSHPLAREVLHILSRLSHSGYNVLLCWVPGHTGIKGNELADVAAKSATTFCTVSIPLIDLKHSIKKIFRQRWQDHWNVQTENKLHSVKPIITYWSSSSRRQDVLLTRLRIGHTRLTHRHLLLGKSVPVCPHCQGSLSVSHILTDCPDLHDTYIHFFHTQQPTLENLIGETPHPAIFHFLRFTGLHFEI